MTSPFRVLGTYGPISAARACTGTPVPNPLPLWQLERGPFSASYQDGENLLGKTKLLSNILQLRTDDGNANRTCRISRQAQLVAVQRLRSRLMVQRHHTFTNGSYRRQTPLRECCHVVWIADVHYRHSAWKMMGEKFSVRSKERK